MAKYYVQSGNLRMVMDAFDVNGAALWAVHSKLVDVECDKALSDEYRLQQLKQALDGWDAEISISELGFNRADSIRLDTCEVAMQWHHLRQAIERAFE